MTEGSTLNLNLATRPRRNRRLYAVAVWGLAVGLVALAGLGAFAVLKYGGEISRLKAEMAATSRVRDEASREEKRLKADIGREEKISQGRVDLVNAIIQRKMFSWTGFLTELEKALPGPSYLTALSPSFMADGRVAVQMRVTSRSLDDLLAFITALTAHGFQGPKVGGEQRSEDGRLISEISATYEHPL
jgi:Tfp pilus assembly protein PilN